jgi:hypothetical protein
MRHDAADPDGGQEQSDKTKQRDERQREPAFSQ